MKVLRLHHAGILVHDPGTLSAALGALGMPCTTTERFGNELDIGFHSCTNALVEVISPRTDSCWNARWLERTGPCIQHLAFQVDDIDGALAELGALGIGMMGQAPRPGAGGTTIAFLDPAATGSVLLELVFDPASAVTAPRDARAASASPPAIR